MKANVINIGHFIHWASIAAGIVAGIQSNNVPIMVVSTAQIIHKILDSVDTEK